MKNLLFTLGSLIITFTSYSQIISEEDIFQGEKLIETYFTPMTESFGAGLNNGWYNTAKPHKFGGFDVTFTLNTVIIPNSAETFKIEDSFGGIFTSNNDEGSTMGLTKVSNEHEIDSAISTAFSMSSMSLMERSNPSTKTPMPVRGPISGVASIATRMSQLRYRLVRQ